MLLWIKFLISLFSFLVEGTLTQDWLVALTLCIKGTQLLGFCYFLDQGTPRWPCRWQTQGGPEQ